MQALADVAAAVAQAKGVVAPQPQGQAGEVAQAIAQALLSGERKAVLLGNAAAHHAQASNLLALAQWIGENTGATVGYLTEAANTVGAQWVGAMPTAEGLNAAQMLAGRLRCALLLNTEPQWDSAVGAQAVAALGKVDMVITMSPFKANMEFSDVLLPIAPFTETSGSFINAEGRVQSFHAVVKPLGETRPGWKVLRVLGNLLGLSNFDFETSQEILTKAVNVPSGGLLDMSTRRVQAQTLTSPAQAGEPVVASIYQLDGIVRRAASLQLTVDARLASGEVPA